jgi:hypothetical protein
MTTIIQSLKKHSIFFIFYLLFSLLCARIGIMSLSGFKREDHIDGGLPYIFTIFLAIVFVLILIINAILRKTDKSFYLWFCLVIAIQTFIVISIG